MRVLATVLCGWALSVSAAAAEETANSFRIRPLAEDFTILYRSPDPQTIYVGDASLAVCPNGRLIGCFSIGGPNSASVKPQKGTGNGFIYTSDDDGKTWVYRNNFPMSHFRPFTAGQRLYILGQRKNLRVLASDDWGDTWTEFTELTEKEAWHGSGTNVWYRGKFVYLVMERRRVGQMETGWKVAELAPILLRGDTTKDLTQRENWTFASDLVYHEEVSDQQMEWFGIPFHDGYYPNVKRRMRGGSGFHPLGWLEANVVQIVDPNHYWYDSTGHTFHIFLRAHTGVTNLGCVVKAVEQPDGTIQTMFQTSPSGKTHLYLPLPGGQMKFSVVYDEPSKLYWMVSTQSTDSMTRVEKLPADRYCLSDNERRRLVLHFSKNMVDWCFAGVVSIGPVEKASRHYAQVVIKGDDLLVMSRSGDENAKDAHNGDIITFHRIENFRTLVY